MRVLSQVILPFWLTTALGLDVQQPLLSTEIPISQPPIGFGTWNLKISPQNTSDVVSLAIQTGYRQIDCAAAYGNEKDVGRGIKDGLKKAGLRREDIWVTSKLWNDHHGDPARVEAGLNQTLKDLDLEYLDLYLMHWPVSSSPKTKKNEIEFIDTWKSMTTLPKSRVLNIGISNFSPPQLVTLLNVTDTKPFAHQMELHPYLSQPSWLVTHKALGIAVTAYSPLGNSNPTYDDGKTPVLKNPVMVEIVKKRNCTAAQVALSWGMSRGTSVIPKSSHRGYIEENFAAQECVLKDEDLLKIEHMAAQYLTRFNNPSKGWGVKLFEGLEGIPR